MTKYTLGFMFSENKDDVLLIRKAKPDWQAGKLNGLGGHLEPGESWVEGMIREFREEAHLDTTAEDWKSFGYLAGAEFSIRLFYAVSNDIYKARSTTAEAVRITRVEDIHKVAVVPHIQWLVPLAQQGTYVVNGIYMPDMPKVMERYDDV